MGATPLLNPLADLDSRLLYLSAGVTIQLNVKRSIFFLAPRWKNWNFCQSNSIMSSALKAAPAGGALLTYTDVPFFGNISMSEVDVFLFDDAGSGYRR